MSIKISVTNKHAQLIGAHSIVCGNSGYIIDFTFDAEWTPRVAKTVRFVYVKNGAVTYTDVVMTDDTVEVPILSNIQKVRVGVFEGNLRTTTPAVIPCERSIRCGTGAPADPTPSQYDQIMDLLASGGGQHGQPGANGITPHIGANGNWFIGETDTGVKAQGDPGQHGQPGANGITPHIGANGNWFIGETDTGVKAQGDPGQHGQPGANGITPHIGANGNWFIGETDTGVKAQGDPGQHGQPGANGITPHIGANGNWFIGETDTGVKAQGDPGQHGQPGANGITPHIGANGNWFIGETDTGVKAQGDPGQHGQPGANGITPHIGANGNWFIGETDTGVKAQGDPGQHGQPGEYNLNPLYGKKVSFLGDSICAGGENTHVGGYGKIIAERNNMVYENLARGGSTITAETYTHSEPISAKGWICRMVDIAAVDADYVIVEGGINDASQWRNHGDLAIGEITQGYNAVLDDTTYYGAFESMLKRLVTRFAGKKIGYIAIPKTNEFFDSEKNVPNFYHIALECCAKWGVSVCDLNTITPPTSYLYSLGTEYTPDGVHPNYEGYIKYYCDPIESWMKTLTTGGNNSATVARKAVEEYTKGFNDAITALQNGKLDNTGIAFKKAKLTLVDGTILEIDVLTAIDGSVVIPYINRIPISIDTDGTTYGEDYNGDGENDGYLKGKRLSSSGAPKDAEGSYVTGYIQAKGGDEIRIFGCGWGTKLNAMNYICAYDENFNFIGAGATTAGVETTTLKSYTATVATLKSVAENADTTLTLADNSNIAYIRISTRGDAQSYDTNLNFANAIVTVNEPIT